MSGWALLALTLSCSGGIRAGQTDSATGGSTSLVEEPRLYAPSPDATPLAWRLEVLTSEPTRVELLLDDGTGGRSLSSDSAEETHMLPVLGLRSDRAVSAQLIIWDGLNRVLETRDLSFETPPLPVRFPDLEVLAHDPGRMEPGHVLLDLKVPSSDDAYGNQLEEVAYLVVLDEDLEVVWFFEPPYKIGAVGLTPDQQLMGLTGGNAVLWDWYGEPLATWRSNADARSPIAVDAKDFHHEIIPESDGGFWTLSFQVTSVDAYPLSYGDPTALGGETLIDDSVALYVNADGTVRDRWAMSERLDTTRIGYDSLDSLGGERWDWSHANALVLDPADGGLLVSVRHQDAIAKLDAEGDLLWILASHAGWSEAFLPFLLQPVGELSWPYHQHAPSLADDGTLLVFDNGTQGHNPYEADDAVPSDVSRVVAYRIDQDARTVEQLWEFRDTLTGQLYASALSGVDPLPVTGNVLSSWGFLESEGGVDNIDMGRGVRSVRLIQVHPDALEDPVFDLRIGSDWEVEPEGWKSYRAQPIPRLQDLRPGQ